MGIVYFKMMNSDERKSKKRLYKAPAGSRVFGVGVQSRIPNYGTLGLARTAVMRKHNRKPRRIALFGHFDATNFGNEATLQAALYHLRCYQPDAEVTCISTGPKATLATRHLKTIPISSTRIKPRPRRNLLVRLVRGISIDVPVELCRWIRDFVRLRSTSMLIIPGTGLLTDAYGVRGWGPYNMFKWSLIAKAWGCKLVLVSVGVGPIDSALGRFFVKSILALADFRSYRDSSSKQYLEGIGCDVGNDRVYPDLVFSLRGLPAPQFGSNRSGRTVVGLGLMGFAGKYGTASEDAHQVYLNNLMSFVRWLLQHKFDVRLFIGDLGDADLTRKFKIELSKSLSTDAEGHVIDEPVYSVEDLLVQISGTDIVVATRFHNVLFALLCNKPVISISFHPKCDSLMAGMGLSPYCLGMKNLRDDVLIERFCDLNKNAETVKSVIRAKIREFDVALEEQYRCIFLDM
jgi:polysaccharide pyruvyl transferase WcaK-like protein